MKTCFERHISHLGIILIISIIVNTKQIHTIKIMVSDTFLIIYLIIPCISKPVFIGYLCGVYSGSKLCSSFYTIINSVTACIISWQEATFYGYLLCWIILNIYICQHIINLFIIFCIHQIDKRIYNS